jgi:AsmA family protein
MTIASSWRHGSLKIAAGSILALFVVAVLALGAMPWGAFKPVLERRLSTRLGRPVTIARIERQDAFSFSPTLRLIDVRAPQARWAGSGDLLRVASITLRFPVLPLLVGRFRPSAIDAAGVRLSLVRDADKRVNWSNGQQQGGSGSMPLEHLTLSDMVVSYRDAAQDRAFTLTVSSGRQGFAVHGTGTVRGAPVTVAATAPAIDGNVRFWPFQAEIVGNALALRARGLMDRPLDVRHMTVDLSAQATDLKMVDAIVEAGLFGTQPVNLRAHAVHDGIDWKIENLRGTIGASDIAGNLAITHRDGRTKLAGSVHSNALDFDDLASNDGLAKAAALEQAQGVKLVPNTRINLRKITHTDGVIAFDIGTVMGGKRPSSIKAMSGTLTIDHQLLTLSPFRANLSKGTVIGTVTVDQHDGRPVPIVSLDLRLAASSIDAIAGGADTVDAPLAGHVHLTGSGSTIREAVGNSTGTIGLAASNGELSAKIAALIGFDVAHGWTTDRNSQATLRCAVARFDVRDGHATADPLIIDTSLSQSQGTGTITFPSETLALNFTGAPKRASLLRLPGSVTLAGTIRYPQLVVPKTIKSVGNVLKGLFQSVTGQQAPKASDADCGNLVSRTLE